MALIWVVEDDLQLQALLAAVLAADGYQVATFSDGNQAIRALGKVPPDLVILDIGLPGSDGVEVCRKLRQHGSLWDVPIVAITGQSAGQDRYRMLGAGADDLLTKPFDSFELRLRVQNHLKKRNPSAEPAAPRILEVGALRLACRNRTFALGQVRASLTPSEFAILKYLMERPGQYMDTETLLVEALGYPPRLGNPNALRTHIRNIRAKLEPAPGAASVLINVPRLGYCVQAPGS